MKKGDWNFSGRIRKMTSNPTMNLILRERLDIYSAEQRDIVSYITSRAVPQMKEFDEVMILLLDEVVEMKKRIAELEESVYGQQKQQSKKVAH